MLFSADFGENALASTRVRKRKTGSGKNGWTESDDALLTKLVLKDQNNVDWTEISRYFPNKNTAQLIERWTKVIDPSLIKGSWTRKEDEYIIQFVSQYGTKLWTKCAEMLPGRIGKQCRERWKNHLDPTIARTEWTQEEDQILIDLHSKYGNHWAKIASCMKGRTDNSIKNRWNSTLSRHINKNNQVDANRASNTVSANVTQQKQEEPKYKENTPAPIVVPQPTNAQADVAFNLKDHLFDDLNSEPNGGFNGTFCFSPPPANDNTFPSLFSPTNSGYDQFMEE